MKKVLLSDTDFNSNQIQNITDHLLHCPSNTIMPFGFGKKDASRRYSEGAAHTDITDTKQLDEIEKIADRLEEDEKVLLVTKQTKNPLKPGGSVFTPNAIIVTDKKVIIRNPSALGMRQKLEYYQYDQIVDVKLERGALSAALEINVPGSFEDARIDAVPKDQAEQILRFMADGVKKAKQAGTSPQVVQQATSTADELAKFASLKEQGIISEEEFQKMKQDLLSK